DFEALVRTGGTLVFLMGVTSLEDICGGLVAAGMDPKTPAAVLQEGTTAGQRRVVADLATLKEEADRANIQAPAIIVVGKVCSLAEKFYWYERLPLAGLRVVVTRPKELISGMSERLRSQGAEVIEMPAIRTQPVDPNPALEEVFAQIASGGAAAAFDYIVFTSPSGVRIFFDAFLKEHDIRALAGIRVAAIGKGSEKALAAYGLKTDFVPSVYDGETLGRELAATFSGGERVLIPRARIGNAELVEDLEKAGAQVTDIPTYDTIHEAAGPVDVAGMLAAGRIDACVFTSASTVTAFAQGLTEEGHAPDFTKVTAVCIGKQTKARADALGMKTIMSEKATMDSVIEKITEKAAELRSAKNV
ncbi:MAG: uroporphyrinogen-III synthase, partial [Lachnospiraceae bacterium]|nr:uroporphyrinogen-III synthase [Lachnospiraceae bacterium]